MNYFDLLLLFILLLGSFYGAMQGITRQLTGLVSIWLGLIISLWLSPLFSEKILKGLLTTASPLILDSFSFILLLILFTAILQGVFIYTTKAPEEKRKKGTKNLNALLNNVDRGPSVDILNALGGIVVGFAVTAVWLSIFLAIARYLLNASGGSSNLSSALSGSRLLPYFSYILGLLHLSVKFFAPPKLPVIFKALF